MDIFEARSWSLLMDGWGEMVPGIHVTCFSGLTGFLFGETQSVGIGTPFPGGVTGEPGIDQGLQTTASPVVF